MLPMSLRGYLESKDVTYRVHRHSPRWTAQETAAAAHVSGKRFAKVVLLRGSDNLGFLLAVLPADEKVDLARLSAIVGEPITLAREIDFQKLFPDCEAGAAPPFGELVGVPVLADACLETQPSIVFNGGTHSDAIEMPWREFVELVAPLVVDYGRAARKDATGATRARREVAVSFLRLAASGRVREAFRQHVARDFTHHNPSCAGDAAALLAAMEDSARENPGRVLEVKRVLADGDLVAVHSSVRFPGGDRGLAMVHLFRFEDGRIAELWDVSQAVPAASPNANGMF